MIGNIVTDTRTGVPLDNNGNMVSKSAYQPPVELMKLFARCQTDYGIAWQLQHRPFQEFDGCSLLQRANLDQQTFGAYVGAEYVPRNKSWRWRGRKNIARNKIIGILAQVMASILIPTVYATDDQNNESKDCAKVMRILIEEHLRRAGYEIKFMFMVLCALVNPATFVNVEYIKKMQNVKVNLPGGKSEIRQAVDDLMSGLMLNIVPVDELLLGDFFIFEMQGQPFLVRLRRISYDTARGIYAKRFFDTVNGKEVDRFDYVQAGKTRVFAATQENQTLYDIEWTEGDRTAVQEATFFYRGEDLQLTWVGGVFMGNFDPEHPEEVYNTNQFTHRRMTQVGDAWGSMPVYPFAKSGAEPLDPQMRFAYYKSIAFKEFWDDATLNMAHRLLVDGMHLDVMKPILISGISKYDSNVIAPGAVASLPKEAVVSPYQLGPNLAAAGNVLAKQESDLADSTIAPILMGQMGTRQSATAAAAALANAKRMLTVITTLIADLIRQIGELSIDCIISNETIGELNEELPGSLGMKFATFLVRGSEKGRDVTHKIRMTDKYIGRVLTEKQKQDREWHLWEEAGGTSKDAMKIWEINPYQFARRKYTCAVDADEMLDMSTGAVQARKDKALSVLTSPMVAPWTDQEQVVNDFAIEEYGGNDPERYKRKTQPGQPAPDPSAMMSAMGMNGAAGNGQGPNTSGAVDAAHTGLPMVQ